MIVRKSILCSIYYYEPIKKKDRYLLPELKFMCRLFVFCLNAFLRNAINLGCDIRKIMMKYLFGFAI